MDPEVPAWLQLFELLVVMVLLIGVRFLRLEQPAALEDVPAAEGPLGVDSIEFEVDIRRASSDATE